MMTKPSAAGRRISDELESCLRPAEEIFRWLRVVATIVDVGLPPLLDVGRFRVCSAAARRYASRLQSSRQIDRVGKAK